MKKLIPITAEKVKALGWETEDGVGYVLMLDDRRHIDLFCVDGDWSFQLTEEPTFKGEEPAMFSGRIVFYVHELLDLYSAIMGQDLTRR